jgi:hypothetical protein
LVPLDGLRQAIVVPGFIAKAHQKAMTRRCRRRVRIGERRFRGAALQELVSQLGDALPFVRVGFSRCAIGEEVGETRPVLQLQQQSFDGVGGVAIVRGQRERVKSVFERLFGPLSAFVELCASQPRIAERP